MNEPDEETKPAIIEAEFVERVPEPPVEERDLLKMAFRSLRSENTRRAYAGHWKRFAAASGQKPEPFLREYIRRQKADALDMLHEWRDEMADDDKSAATIAAAMRAIVSVVHKLHMAEVAPWTLKGLVVAPKPERYTDVTGVSPETVAAMISTLRAQGTDESVRDLAILYLLHDSALRRREIASLQLTHYRPDERKVYVWPKGKARGIRAPQPVSKAGFAAIEAWLDIRGREPGPLFHRLTAKGTKKPIDGDNIRYIVERWAKVAGVQERVSPHRFRHAGITAFAKKCRDPKLVQAFARHSSFDTTTIYIHNAKDAVREEMDEVFD